MTKKEAVERGVILMAVGAALTLVSLDREDIHTLFPLLSLRFFTACSVLGFILGLGGILLVVLPIKTIQEAMYWIKDVLGLGEKAFQTKVAKRGDLKPIHEYGRRMIGGSMSDLQRAERWFDINRQIFWKIIDSSGRHEARCIGYYAVIPLNKEATDLLETERIDGTAFEPEHIIPFKPKRIRKTPTSIYIGGVAANKKKRIRSFVLGSLISHLEHEKEAGVKVVFTRPVTEDGLRLVKKYKFQAVNRFLREKNQYKMDHIYRYEFPSDGDT